MVRDPGRAPSGQPPSQGGQPDRQERHRTHRTGAGEVRTTPSTVSGGRPPTYRGGSSGGGSSEGGRSRVSSGAASRGSGQTSIPVSVPASRPSTFAPATTGRGSGPSGEGPSRPTLGPLDVSQMFEAGANVAAFTRTQMQEWVERVLERGLEQFAAQYGLGRGTSPAPSGGGASTDRVDDTRRRRSRSSHEDDHDTRDRRRSRRSPDVDRERRPHLAIATRLAAKYDPVSVRYQNAERRVEIRREKNVMVTNPFRHQGFAGFRARFKKVFGMYPLPKHTAFARAHGIKRVFQFMENGRDIPESDKAGPSNAEAGEDGAADDDFAAAAAAGAVAAAAAGTGDGVDDDALSDFSEGLRGAELEEDELGLSPQQEQHAESGGDDEDDTDTSPDLYQIRPALCEPAQPTVSSSQRLARLVVGAPQLPATSTVVPAPPAPKTLVPAPPAPRTVVPRPSVRGTVVPSASVARTDTPQPSAAQTPLAARSVVPKSSAARTVVTQPSVRQIRAHTQPASTQGTEGRKKKSKKSRT
ncbi:hypothetical protein R1sor_005230 [Riccia sorocarpa]|uniref:Uncharacterized protein n=1 Tax=Riccia sorocarpa TaxID=122646 RepID=A0ABD3HQH3_9MARC